MGIMNHIPAPTLADYDELRRYRETKGNHLSRGTAAIPLVSIVTVVRNAREAIEKTIHSVLGQTYENIEYVIIDGGSTDGTLDILQSYDRQLAFWLSEPDEGISDAFNKGIACASGDLIGLINAGDWYEPDAVKRVVEHYVKRPTDVLFGDLQIWEGTVRSHVIYPREDLLPRRMTLNHPTMFVARRGYERLGLFRKELRLTMDYEWILRAKKEGLAFSRIPRVLAHMEAGGVSSQNWLKTRWEMVQVKNLYAPGLKNYAEFVLQVGFGVARRLMERAGLKKIARRLQERLSI